MPELQYRSAMTLPPSARPVAVEWLAENALAASGLSSCRIASRCRCGRWSHLFFSNIEGKRVTK